MKISITTSVAPRVTALLCNHGETEPLDDSRIASSFAVQEVHYFRAQERTLIYRGQHAFDQTIHVFRKATDAGFAERDMLDETTRGMQGLIEFELLGPNRSVGRRYLRNGIVMLLSAWNTGSQSDYIYRIMGGMIRNTP